MDRQQAVEPVQDSSPIRYTGNNFLAIDGNGSNFKSQTHTIHEDNEGEDVMKNNPAKANVALDNQTANANSNTSINTLTNVDISTTEFVSAFQLGLLIRVMIRGRDYGTSTHQTCPETADSWDYHWPSYDWTICENTNDPAANQSLRHK